MEDTITDAFRLDFPIGFSILVELHMGPVDGFRLLFSDLSLGMV